MCDLAAESTSIKAAVTGILDEEIDGDICENGVGDFDVENVR